jgi:hypothetical protein
VSTHAFKKVAAEIVLLFSVTLAVYRTLGVNTIYNIRRWRRSGLESQLYINSRFWNCFIFLLLLLLLCATPMHYYSTNSLVMLLTHLRFGQLRRGRLTPFRLNIPSVPTQPQVIRLYARFTAACWPCTSTPARSDSFVSLGKTDGPKNRPQCHHTHSPIRQNDRTQDR